MIASHNHYLTSSIRDIQVLCPMNRGGLGARSLNIELQPVLNPPGDIRIDRFGWTFWRGDKVMQVENDYDKDVYNGDLGTVSAIDMEESELVAISMAAKSATPLSYRVTTRIQTVSRPACRLRRRHGAQA